MSDELPDFEIEWGGVRDPYPVRIQSPRRSRSRSPYIWLESEHFSQSVYEGPLWRWRVGMARHRLQRLEERRARRLRGISFGRNA